MKTTLVLCVVTLCLLGTVSTALLWLDRQVEIRLAEEAQADTTDIDRTIEWILQKNLPITPTLHESMGFVVIRYRGREFLATTRGGICLVE